MLDLLIYEIDIAFFATFLGRGKAEKNPKIDETKSCSVAVQTLDSSSDSGLFFTFPS